MRMSNPCTCGCGATSANASDNAPNGKPHSPASMRRRGHHRLAMFRQLQNRPYKIEGDSEMKPGYVVKRWYTVAEVAEMLGFGLSKTKMLVATRELRSLKDGGSRRILPEWVDEYVRR